MKNKIIGLTLLTCVNLFALDINEAIKIAQEHNYNLKQQQYILDESKISHDSSQGAYRPKLDLAYTYNNRDKLITGQIEEDSTLSVYLTYNLFNGFKDKYNISSSEKQLNYAKLSFKAYKEDLKLNVKTTYITYLLNQKNSQTLNEALKLYEKQYKDSSNFFAQGLIAQNELLQVEVEMLQAKQNHQKAISDERIAKKRLENILGTKLTTNQKIDELKNDEISSITFDNKNLNNRSEIKALEQLVQSYTTKTKSLKGNYYPKVDAQLSHNKYGEDLVPTNRISYPDSQNIGTISLNWNLYNGNQDKLSLLVNKKKTQQIKMQIEDLKLQINLQYEEAVEDLNVAKLNFITASKAKEQSELNYNIVKNKVKEGLSANSDLIDANYLLTKSKQNYFSAYYNQYLAIAKLQRVFEK